MTWGAVSHRVSVQQSRDFAFSNLSGRPAKLQSCKLIDQETL